MTDNQNNFMPLREEAIVRIVHARGETTLGELLTDFRSRPMSADTARNALRRLVSRGWLVRSSAGTPGRRAHWSVSRQAVPHLQGAQRLPAAPGQLRADAAAASRYGLAPMARPIYTPPAGAPVREGAADFLRVPSLGAFP